MATCIDLPNPASNDSHRQEFVVTSQSIDATPDDDVALWVAFAAPLRNFVRKRTPVELDPEDILQDIFLRMARHRDEIRNVEHVEAWVYQIARTAVADALRAHRRREARLGHAAVEDFAEQVDEDNQASALAELSPCLAPFVSRLDEPYRSALEMTSIGGLTQAEAAARAGISLSGMKSRVQRARNQVRSMLVRCCALDVDARGGVVDFAVRDPSVCGPRDGVASSCGIERLHDQRQNSLSSDQENHDGSCNPKP